jgi:hypothetical protein
VCQPSPALTDGKQRAAVLRIKALRRLRGCALPVCGFGEGDRPAPKFLPPRPVRPGFFLSCDFSGWQHHSESCSRRSQREAKRSRPSRAALIDRKHTRSNGKQRAAVLRIKALRRLRGCALPVCGFGEADRPASEKLAVSDFCIATKNQG